MEKQKVIVKVYVSESQEKTANCNGGDYPRFWAVDESKDKVFYGRHCACWNGCSNTTSRLELERLFPDWDGEISAISHKEWVELDRKLYDKYRTNLVKERARGFTNCSTC